MAVTPEEHHRPRPPTLHGGLEIVRDGCCAVEPRRADGRLLARHEARSSLSDQVLVSRYAWSDSKTRLAYRLNEETTALFSVKGTRR